MKRKQKWYLDNSCLSIYVVKKFRQNRNMPSKSKCSFPSSYRTTVNICLYSSIKILMLIPEYMFKKLKILMGNILQEKVRYL